MKRCWLALAFLFTTAARSHAEPVEFHVAPHGNDQQAGTREKPFATPARARAAIRSLKRSHGGAWKTAVTVVLRGGTYVLPEPLTFAAEDAGTAAGPITWTAAAGETPLLSGGRRILGWKAVTVEGKALWAADLPEVRAGKWMFHQLWVNGQRRSRARHPNQGFLRIAALPDATPKTPYNEGQNRFQFAPGDLRPWDNLEDVNVVVHHLWVGVRLAVTRVDARDHLVTFLHKSRRRLTEGPLPARYYVENALELLDAPGEWYLQRKTGTLYYWPMPGETMADVEVIAPVLPHLLRLDGKAEAKQFVEHVTFRGLTFAHAEWWLPRNDPGDIQAAAGVPAALQGDGARHCAFDHCTIAHVSNYALHLARGCQHNRITGCHAFDLGAGGIRIGEMAQRQAADEQTHDNLVSDNHVHDGGHVFPQAVAVWVGQSFANRIAHNHLHDFQYTGISVGWTWGYGKTLARDNLVELNDVHDLGREQLNDLAGIYTLGVQPGTVIRGNVFRDIAGYRYGGWGIYFDEGSTHIVAENNLVYRTTHGGFHQHFGKENVVRNNIFAFGRDAQIQRTRIEAHRSFTFERNLVYWREGKLLAGKWDTVNAAFDHNCYWRTDGKEIQFDRRTWAQWRALGQDEHSLRADPMFENAARNDFRLGPLSPARQVGFVPLDLSGVGPRRRQD